MLQAIRSKADSLFVKVLFALLIVSFVGWGVYYALPKLGSDTSVAFVGDQKITPEQLNQSVRQRITQLRQVFGAGFDIEQAKQLGVVDQQLGELINNALIGLEVNRLQLAIGDDAVRGVIFGDPNFKSATGQFDRQRYQQILAQSGMSEAQYESGLRANIVRRELVQSVVSGVAAPKPLVDALYHIRAEKRVAETVFLPYALVTDVGQPSESDLQDFHDKHPDLFRAPELRSFTVAIMNVDDLAKTLTVSDDELRDEYQKRLDEFQTPERRHVEQILAPDQATADQIESALKGGKTFAAAAEAAKLSGNPLDLGTVTQKDLPDPQIASAAFALAKDGISDPIKSAFGWHILHVVAIEPARVEAFDQAKPKVLTEMQRAQASDAIDRLSKRADDELAASNNLEKLASDLGMKLVSPADVDKTGHTVNGGAVEIPPPSDEILQTVFGTEQGQMSNVTDTSDGGFYVIRVDKVTPSMVRPLSDVHDRVLSAWQQAQRIDRVGKQAKEILDAVNGGTALKDVAAQRSLQTTTTSKLERQGNAGGLPDTLVTALFHVKPHQAASGQSADGAYVAELTEIIPADTVADKAQVNQLTQQLASTLQQDLLTQYEAALRQHFSVTIDRDRVDHAF